VHAVPRQPTMHATPRLPGKQQYEHHSSVQPRSDSASLPSSQGAVQQPMQTGTQGAGGEVLGHAAQVPITSTAGVLSDGEAPEEIDQSSGLSSEGDAGQRRVSQPLIQLDAHPETAQGLSSQAADQTVQHSGSSGSSTGAKGGLRGTATRGGLSTARQHSVSVRPNAAGNAGLESSTQLPQLHKHTLPPPQHLLQPTPAFTSSSGTDS
jgi:hypothetical protein